MRIVHVLFNLDPAFGGPPRVACGLAAAQAHMGHETMILCSYGEGKQPGLPAAFSDIPGIEDVGVTNLQRPDIVELFLSLRARRALRSAIDANTVVHIHGVWEPLLWEAARVCQRVGAPYVVRPLSVLNTWVMERYRWRKAMAFRLGVRMMLSHAGFIQALTNDEASMVAPYAFGTPVRVIPNGIFLEQFEPFPSPGDFYRMRPCLRDRPYVLFLSRLNRQKGLNYLAEAFALLAERHPEVDLVVAGPDGGQKASFETAVHGAGLQHRVHVVGPLYGREKVAALRDALCFCLPSLNEGFSNAILESLACGTPVVISTQCFFAEVGRQNAGLVVALDPSAIAEALDQIIGNQELRQQMSLAACRLIRTAYLWSNIARHIIEAYRGLLCRTAADSTESSRQ